MDATTVSNRSNTLAGAADERAAGEERAADKRAAADEQAAAAWVAAFAEGWRAPIDADSFADHFERWLDPSVVLVQPQVRVTTGHQAFREQFARPLFDLIPDLHGAVQGWAARGGVVYIELLLEGTIGRRPVTLRTVDRVTLRDGLAIERVAHLDPTPLLAAVVLTPRTWPRMARLQIENLLGARRRRSA